MTALPDVPTTAEAGMQGLRQRRGWFMMLAPKGTPKPIVAKLNQEVTAARVGSGGARALHRARRRGARRHARGARPELIASETAKWRDIIHKAGIPPIQ